MPDSRQSSVPAAPLVDAAGWSTSAHPECLVGERPPVMVMGTVSAVFPGAAEFAAQARGFARRSLPPGHAAADTVELCVTELFANAVAYTRSGRPGGQVTVTVGLVGGAVVVTVADQGAPEAPLMGGPAWMAEHGRGLVLVDALTDDWGTAPEPGGRVVWFRCGGGDR